MNIDTDTQWAFWDGVRQFESGKRAYLQGQIGNPDGAEKPNKKYYDPRVWMRKGEESMCKRVTTSMEKLGSLGQFEPIPGRGEAQIGKGGKKGGVDVVMVGAAVVAGVAIGMVLGKR